MLRAPARVPPDFARPGLSDTAATLQRPAVSIDSELPPVEPDLAAAHDRVIRHVVLVAMAVAAALAMALSLVLGQALAPTLQAHLGRWGLALLQGVWGLVLLLSLLAWRAEPQRAWLWCQGLALGTVAVSGAVAWAGGWLAWLPALPLVAVAVCMAAATGPRLLGQGVLVLALALVLVLTWTTPAWFAPLSGAVANEGLQAAPGATGTGASGAWTSWLPALLALATLLAAAAVGSLLAHLVAMQQREAGQSLRQREALLRLSADVYWETDASLRFRTMQWRDRRGRLNPVHEHLGSRPWDVPVLAMHADTLDLLRADTDGRDRFQRVLVAWRCPDGQRRHFQISGEPAFDASRQFTGYWGVARDVSAERGARRAMRGANEQFQRLFRRNPTPLILHRHGRILAANAAAAVLLGYDTAEAMVGHDLLIEHMDDEQRELALERLDDLDADRALEALPMVPRRLLRCDGSPVYTLATGMRSDQANRPALLAIYLDETARHAAMLGQHRSETMLSRLLAISPDLIALVAWDGGRCVMVNDSLGRLLGLARSDWVGPTASGPWHAPEEHQRLLRAVEDEGVARDFAMTFNATGERTVTLLVSATRMTLDDGVYLLLSARVPDSARSVRHGHDSNLVAGGD